MPTNSIVARAFQDTNWFSLKTDVLPALIGAVGTAIGTYYYERHRESAITVSDVIAPALLGLGFLAVYWVVVNGTEFVWNLTQAGNRIEIDRLKAIPQIHMHPAIRVTPVFENGVRYLIVENKGSVAAEFEAEIDIVRGLEDWFVGPHWTTLPYKGFWENSATETIRLLQGQRGRLAIGAFIPQGGNDDPFLLVQLIYYEPSSRRADGNFGRWFGRRIDSVDEIDSMPPLVVRVLINSHPAMVQPFIGNYRLVRGALELVHD